MTQKPYVRLPMLAAALLFSLGQVGCQRTEQPYTVAGGYTFSQDFDMERRVLRIEASSEQPAACIETRLPSETSVSPKRTLLDPTIHRALLDLLLDETRLPSYQADLDAAEERGTFICGPRPKEADFCYKPQLVVTGDVPKVFIEVAGASDPTLVRSPLRFGLQEHIALSSEGRELIGAFLAAHEACWNSDD